MGFVQKLASRNPRVLNKKAVDKKKVDKLPEIHRPWIDDIKIKCSKCGKESSRVLDVGDVWLDAGIVPFSTLNYLTDKKYWEKWFPADLISESMPGQSRGWFNALFFASVTLTGKVPFKSLFGYETVKDEKGEEMHKSKGNTIWFDDAVEEVGADPIRLLYCLQDPAQELKFGFGILKKELKNQINILSNINRLVENSKESKNFKIEDKWILSKLNSLIKKVTRELENMHPHLATRALKDFWLNDLSRSYIQFVRDRISSNDFTAKSVLRKVYIELIKLLSPIVPFACEKVWQNLREKKIVKEESVHLCPWPKFDEKKIDKRLEDKMNQIKDIISVGLMERDMRKVGIRWPYKNLVLSTSSKENKKLIKEFELLLKTQLNVENVIIKESKNRSVLIGFEDFQVLLEEKGYSRELSRKVQAFRKKLGLNKEQNIELSISVDNRDFGEALEKNKDFIKHRTNAKKMKVFPPGEGNRERFEHTIDFNIRDNTGWIAIKNPR